MNKISDFVSSSHQAKLVMTDIGLSDGSLYTTYWLDNLMTVAAAGAGAKIHTNSWGVGADGGD